MTAAARIPEIHPTVELFPISYLVRAQTAYRTLDAAPTWLHWFTLLILIGGVLLARSQRRAVIAAPNSPPTDGRPNLALGKPCVSPNDDERKSA